MLPAADIDRISAYITANTTTEKYQIAIQWAPQAGQFLLRDISALPVGGFTAQVPTITPERLTQAVADRELHFALVDGPATKGKPTPDHPDYAIWVRQNCQPVSQFDQPLYTLYDCRR